MSGEQLEEYVNSIESRIAELEAENAEAHKVMYVLAKDRERQYLRAQGEPFEDIPEWAIEATVKWATDKAKEAGK